MKSLILTCLLLNSFVISAPAPKNGSNNNLDPSEPIQILGPIKHVQPSPLSTQSVVIATTASVDILDVANVLQMAAQYDITESEVKNVLSPIGVLTASLSSSLINTALQDFGTANLIIEPNVLIEIADRERFDYQGSEKNCPSWGKNRIASKNLNEVSSTYTFEKCGGRKIDVYLLDTGINVNHPNFEGRARNIANTIDPGQPADDDNGHGTMVAGMCGATVYGAYSNVNLLGVKCINAGGLGTLASILDGCTKIVDTAKNRCKGKKKRICGLVNISLAGPASGILNDVVKKMVEEHNLAVFAAAGNYGVPADFLSPASAEAAFTVASTDPSDYRPWFTNWGSLVDMHAPGVSVLTTTIGSGAPITQASGTSLSTPLATGVAASFCNCRKYNNPKELYADLTDSSTVGAIKNGDPYTPNRILYNKLPEDRKDFNHDDDDHDDD